MSRTKHRNGFKNYFSLRLGVPLWNKLNNYHKTRNEFLTTYKADILIEAINYHLPQWIGEKRSKKILGYTPVNIDRTKMKPTCSIESQHYSMSVEMDEEYLKQIKIIAIEKDMSWRSMMIDALDRYLTIVTSL